jgi:hypothetical protein
LAQAYQDAAKIAADAADRAAAAQKTYGDLAIAEQQRQFALVQEKMRPYEAAGTDALGRQRSLLGLDGADAQRSLIEGIGQSPEMLAMIGQGEDALRQQGAATGGLRGGNTAAALAQFRPSMLSELINQQYSKLGGLSQLGYSAASNVGQAGLQTGSKISDLLTYQGDASAQGILNRGNAIAGGDEKAAQAIASGRMSAAEAAALGLTGAAGFRSTGMANAGLYRGQGIRDAGATTAAGQYGYAQGQAGANSQRWAPISQVFKDIYGIGMNYLGGKAGGGVGGGSVPAGGGGGGGGGGTSQLTAF